MKTTPEEVAILYADRRAKSTPRQPPTDNRLLQQASVATAQLTGDPLWDVFLQRVQAMIDAARADLAAMAENIALPNLTSEQILMGHRHMVAKKERIEAWVAVLELPLSIMAASRGAEQKTGTSA